MIEILYLIFIILISLALGQKILRLIGIKFDSYLENFIFSFPLGLALLAYITFFLGILGILYKSVFIIVLLIMSAFLYKDIINIISTLCQFIKNFDLKKSIRKYKLGFNFFTIFIAFILVFTFLNFIMSFSPAWNFDVLVYHLAVPKLYIDAHKIIYLPYLFYSNLPSLVDIISLNGLLLHNAILSNLFAYTLGIVLLLAIYSFCRRFFNFKVAVLASLIFYTFPMIISGSSTTNSDIQFALFAFLAFYGLVMYIISNQNQWLIVCSIFTGLTISAKIFGVVASIGIFILLVVFLMKKEFNYKAFSKIMFFSLMVLSITSPFILKSYFFTGNPVFPFFTDVFDTKYWDAEHQENLARRGTQRDVNIINFIRIPWDIHTNAKSDNIAETEMVGVFFLAFMPLYFISRKHKVINLFFILLFIYFIIWFFFSNVIRHIVFVLPIIAIISSYVIVELLKRKEKFLIPIINILLVFTFSFNILLWFGGNVKEIPVVLGLESEDEFYSKHTTRGIYLASEYINSNLPEDSKILLFRETRGYFIDRKYILGDPLMQTYIDYKEFKDEEDFYKRLKDLGITHILVNNGLVFQGFILNEQRYSKRILKMMDNLLREYTTNLYENEGVVVNELR